ncbi:MAG: NlpC/P60 family protein [Bacteroidota bacterium]
MNFRFFSFALLPVLAISLFSCSPQRQLQRYSYLIDDYKAQPMRPTPRPSAHTTPAVIPIKPAPAATATATLSRREVRELIATAESYEGTPYRLGGMSRKGIDCSGLVCKSYESIGRSVPRTTSQMSRTGKNVSKKRIQPGHLVFFNSKNSSGVNHVGLVTEVRGETIYFVHATTSRGVRTDNLSDPYWAKRYRKAVAM